MFLWIFFVLLQQVSLNRRKRRRLKPNLWAQGGGMIFVD
jgi:hypothetical protein